MSAGFGYQQSNQSSNQSSQGGFRDLSPEIQGVFNNLATQANTQLNDPNLTSRYTPLAQTSGETNAVNTINGINVLGNLQGNIQAQMNPYNQSVINQINRNAYGQNSALQSQLDAAGQFGSNRATLGANDIANTQADQINSFLGNQYNTSLQNALTTIPQSQIQGANAQLQAGQFQRGLYGQQQQAPIAALQGIASILGVLPTQSSQSQGQSQGNSFGFNVSGGYG